MYHLMIPARTLPLPAWHAIFQITSFFRLYVNSSKKGKICHLTLWLTPSLPHVLFADTVATREPPSLPPHRVSRIIWMAPHKTDYSITPRKPGINFINVLRTAFTFLDPKREKKILMTWLSSFSLRSYGRKSCAKYVGEIDTRLDVLCDFDFQYFGRVCCSLNRTESRLINF